MMEALTGSPLTLVVKAPNQEIGDQTVECFLDWTVRKLKKHLSTVYPTNPNERSQRIIYSGKLLQDNVLLKDVISANDVQERCTVHLVCTPSPEEMAKTEAFSRMRDSVRPRPAQTRSPVLTTRDGLRQRSTTPAHQSASPSIPQHTTVFPNATALPSVPSSVPVPQPGVMPTAPMSPQQMQWMQQMQAQQMAAYQYMQYANMMAATGGMAAGWNQAHPMASPWIQATTPNPAHPVPPQQPAPQAADNAANQAAPPPANNAPQQMNVGGGQAMDDDNEDGGRRDWLDWTFTLCRFGILLSIVYFYSSVNRFLVVAGAMFVMYLYQAGFFQLRRRQRNRPPVTPPQEQTPPPENGPEGGEAESNDNQTEDSDASTSSGDEVDGTGSGAEPDEPPRPGVLVTAWVFISTFFTSIIPQGPPRQFPAN